MKRLAAIVLLVACEKNAAKIPDDHQIHRTDTAERTTIIGKAVDVATLPLPRDVLILPVSGTADVDIDIKAPARDYSHANGHVVLHCTGCRIGDDKATIPVPQLQGKYAAYSGTALSFGHLDFDRIDVDVAIADGKATVKTFDVASKDVEIHLSGGAALARELSEMNVDLCLRFKPTEALQARDPKTDAVLTTTGANVAGDGLFNIKLTDRLSSLKRLAVICDGSAPPPEPQVISDPPMQPDPAPLDPAVIAAAVHKIDDTHYEIDPKLIDKVLADPMSIAHDARVVPAVRDGKAIGFKMYKISAGGIFEGMGFRDGDTILSVDGFEMSSADKALETYTKLRELAKSGATLTIQIERSGSPTSLSYKIR